MFLVIMEKFSLRQCRAYRASNDANLNIILAIINIKHEHGTLPRSGVTLLTGGILWMGVECNPSMNSQRYCIF